MLTWEDIEHGLRILGLSRGMAVEVHSSLSSFGCVEGGAITVIKALMDIVGEIGTLIMPTFPMSTPLALNDSEIKRGITYKIRILDPDSNERTGMGVISDTFRHLPGVVTGIGLHRVSAWGRDAERHSEGLSYLIEQDGWALLLGVDIHSLTSMHYREDKLPPEVKAIFTASGEVLEDYPPDKWYVETGKSPVDAWGKIQEEAVGKGFIRHRNIGNSRCMLFKVRDVIDLYEKALSADPFGLYGINQ